MSSRHLCYAVQCTFLHQIEV